MGKKVTKAIIRNNMESFAAFVVGAQEHTLRVRDEHGKTQSMDASPFVLGAWAMAQYVQAVIDGEVPVENDMAKLCSVMTRTSFNEYITHEDAELDEDEEDEEDEGYPSWLDQFISRLEGQPSAAPEGGDGDAE